MFVCSVMAHMCSCLSERAYVWWWRVDYAGILSLWFGRLIFDLYFIFAKCHFSKFQASLFISISVFAVAAPAVIFHRTTSHFIGLFLYIHLPLLYVVLVSEEINSPQLTQYVALNGGATICAVVGFMFFTSRMPEVICVPWNFDVCGHNPNPNPNWRSYGQGTLMYGDIHISGGMSL